MPVTKHEKFIEPPGFAHISQFDLSSEERSALLDPIPTPPPPVEVAPADPEGKSAADTKTPPSGKKSQED